MKINNVISDFTFTGRVVDIEVGKLSRERLYRIRYEDGDTQYLSKEEVANGCRHFLADSL